MKEFDYKTIELGRSPNISGFIYVILIIALNMLDVHNTLFIISKGGIELNPVMNYFLEIDVWLFVFMKMLITTLSLLTLYKYYAKIIKYILLLYLLLIIYQYYIIYFLIGI